MHSKEELTPVLLETIRLVKERLPEELAARMTSSRHVRNHGSYRTLYLFNVWDIHQADILHRDYFVYCLGHCGGKEIQDRFGDGKEWYLHLWINTVRLYRSQSEIRKILESDLKKHCPAGFRFCATDRYVEAKTSFTFTKPLDKLPDFLVPKYVTLIGALHPVLIPIIDSFTQPLSKEERRAVILGRKRQYYGPATRPSQERVREYTRSIPPSWRKEILEKHDGRCVRCSVALTVRTAHMDHIVPFSKGGGTTKDNLQPLCEPCNLKKGNRENH